MSELKNWHNETIANKTVAALMKNDFQATYCPTRQEAVEQILALIPVEGTIGAGGSWTIGQLGLLDSLDARGNIIFNHGLPGLTAEDKMEIRRKQLTCDVFLTSTNAVTIDGRLVNTDGVGNRVAAMIFGPKKVIIVVGINKIVKDIVEAEKRIKLYAAPINNKRLNTLNPCIRTGECTDCQGPTRICNVTTILNKRPVLTDIHIFVIGEELGF
ncbi:MAG: lactate utilization protein [Sporomusaceae bacterium]|nr:lactate utilization protein [Sporomusaceae bacterium]